MHPELAERFQLTGRHLHPRRDDLTGDRLWWARSDSRVVMALDRVGCAALRQLPEGRLRERGTTAWRALIHRGDRVQCPLCGGRFRHFAHRWNAPSVVCWRCQSHERHRALWLFLVRQRPELLDQARSLLHFAPEGGVEALLRARPGLRYVTCDLDPEAAELTIDITAIDLPEGAFDAILCSHVLEHVEDDAAAMRELHRVLAPGGWCIVMVPLDHGAATDEDFEVTDPDERRERFWQEDHVRLYGLDIVERLTTAGFEVEHVRPSDELDEATIMRYRLGLANDVLVCRKPARAVSVP